MKVSVTRKLPGCPSALLSRSFKDVEIWPEPRALTRVELMGVAANTDVLICTLNERIDEELLAGSPRLKCVVTFSVGLDHIDTAAVKAKGIKLSHTPDVLTDATADLTWTLILASARRIKAAVRNLEEGQFHSFDPSSFLGVELRGKILGVVGFGKIGKAVAERATGFGMTVIFCGRPGTTPQSLQDVLKAADVVSLHCPMNEGTKHLISRRELGVMKPQAILVNTARGPLIDEGALLAHVRTNPEFYTGLDVFEFEPKVPEVFRQLPNVFCLPHIGSATKVAREAMGRVCMEEAIRFAQNEELLYEYR